MSGTESTPIMPTHKCTPKCIICLTWQEWGRAEAYFDQYANASLDHDRSELPSGQAI